jgi:hypothetical protein
VAETFIDKFCWSDAHHSATRVAEAKAKPGYPVEEVLNKHATILGSSSDHPHSSHGHCTELSIAMLSTSDKEHAMDTIAGVFEQRQHGFSFVPLKIASGKRELS